MYELEGRYPLWFHIGGLRIAFFSGNPPNLYSKIYLNSNPTERSTITLTTPFSAPTTQARRFAVIAREAIERGRTSTARDAARKLADVVAEVGCEQAARQADRYNLEVEEVVSAMSIDLTEYVTDLIDGSVELPRSLEAWLATVAKRRALSVLRREWRRNKRDVARFGENGVCTPIGSEGESVSTDLISYASVTPSHEYAVIRRMDLVELQSAMTYEQKLVTYGIDALGIPSAEACAALDCLPNALHQKRFRAFKVLGKIDRDGWMEAA